MATIASADHPTSGLAAPDGSSTPVRKVSVIRTGSGAGHREHVYGTRKPALWWIFTSPRSIELPINVYVIEHEDGLVLFDTGMDRAVVTDPDYWPDPITGLFMRHIFRWSIGPEDTLARQLDLAGYSTADVRKAVISHLHADHVGGIGDIPGADLYVSSEAWAHMLGPHPEREMVLRRDIDIPGARWHRFTCEATDDPALAPFSAAYDLMGDGSMVILPTPGHLPGSVSMLVRRRDAAPVLLIGDLTYAEELLDQDRVPGTGDAAQLRASFSRVRGLRDRTPGLVILPAHDWEAADKLAHGVNAPLTSR